MSEEQNTVRMTYIGLIAVGTHALLLESGTVCHYSPKKQSDASGMGVGGIYDIPGDEDGNNVHLRAAVFVDLHPNSDDRTKWRMRDQLVRREKSFINKVNSSADILDCMAPIRAAYDETSPSQKVLFEAMVLGYLRRR